MCYLVAKDTEKSGCIALKTVHGKHLAELKRKLNAQADGIQFVTISRPTAYGEYAPYYRTAYFNHCDFTSLRQRDSIISEFSSLSWLNSLSSSLCALGFFISSAKNSAGVIPR